MVENNVVYTDKGGEELIQRAKVSKKYTVYGKYGELLVGGRVEQTRPESHICSGYDLQLTEVLKKEADAVMILLNPGKKVPLFDFEAGGWKKTVPDLTQAQLILLMEEMQWKKLTILNLFDICVGKVEDFNLLLKICERTYIAHSLFLKDPLRWKKEIASAKRLLFGWGARPEARKLASECGLSPQEGILPKHGKQPIAVWDEKKGYPKHPFQYSPVKCEQWLVGMVEAMKKNAVEAPI